MKRHFVVAMLFGTSCACYGQVTANGSRASGPDAATGEARLSLGVLPEAKDETLEEYVRIAVVSGKRVLGADYGALGKLAVIRGLPPGQVKVVVFALVNRSKGGYFGESTYTIEEKRTNAVKITCTKKEVTECQLHISDSDGNAVADKWVRIRDVTECEFECEERLQMQKGGRLTFFGFAGRTYKAAILEDDGGHRSWYYSQPLRVREAGNVFAWKLEDKKRIIIKLWVETGGQMKPLVVPFLPVEDDTVRIRAVKDARCVLYKEDIPSCVTKLVVDPGSYTVFAGLSVKQGKVIAIDDSVEQAVDVVFAPAEIADLVIRWPEAKGADKTVLARAVFICPDGGVAWRTGLDVVSKVPPGRYGVRVWIPGWKLAAKEVDLKTGKNEIHVALARAGQMKVLVQDEKGRFVADADVCVTYPMCQKDFMDPSHARTARNGECTIPFDEAVGGVLAAIKPGMATTCISVAKAAKDGKIVLTAGTRVTRTVKVSGVPQAVEGYYEWRRRDSLWLTYGCQTPSRDGAVEALLAPGEYSEFFVCRGEYVHLQDIAVKGEDGGKKSVSITAESWQERRKLKDLK